MTADYVKTICRRGRPERVRIELLGASKKMSKIEMADRLITFTKKAGGAWKYDAGLGNDLRNYLWLHK